MVDRSERDGGVHQFLAHCPTPCRIARVIALQLAALRKAFERLHQIKAGADDGRVVAGRDQLRMRHRRVAQRGENARFTQHRSEEHTSELQSLMRISYAVFCLKKKKDKDINT